MANDVQLVWLLLYSFKAPCSSFFVHELHVDSRWVNIQYNEKIWNKMTAIVLKQDPDT